MIRSAMVILLLLPVPAATAASVTITPTTIDPGDTISSTFEGDRITTPVSRGGSSVLLVAAPAPDPTTATTATTAPAATPTAPLLPVLALATLTLGWGRRT